MYYIKERPNGTGNHGNPVSRPSEGTVALPETLLEDYLAAKGFVSLTVKAGTVTALAADRDAYDAYMAEHPDLPPEPTEEEDRDAMLADHELRLSLLELGV